MVGAGMQQDAPEDHLSGMTASVPEINKLELLQSAPEFKKSAASTLQQLSDAAEILELRRDKPCCERQP